MLEHATSNVLTSSVAFEIAVADKAFLSLDSSSKEKSYAQKC